MSGMSGTSAVSAGGRAFSATSNLSLRSSNVTVGKARTTAAAADGDGHAAAASSRRDHGLSVVVEMPNSIHRKRLHLSQNATLLELRVLVEEKYKIDRSEQRLESKKKEL